MAEEIRVTVDVSGFDLFLGAAQDALSRAVQEAADQVVDDARALAPVSEKGSNGNPPGFLRDHIMVNVLDALNVEVESQAEYSEPVEFGHHHPQQGYSVPPHPFFTPAVEAERERFAERVAKALAEVTKA